jgi:hypothetical protein
VDEERGKPTRRIERSQKNSAARTSCGRAGKTWPTPENFGGRTGNTTSQKGKNMILAVAAALMLMTGSASAQVPMQSLRQLPEQLPTTPGEIYQGFASPNISIVKNEVHSAYSKFCEEEWPNDYRMELYCQENQKIAAERLANLEIRIWERAGTTAGQVAERIFKFCRAEWPRDYSMSYYCVENQTEAYNRLQKRR